MNKFSPICAAINRGNTPIRIASHACHEGFQVSLAQCNTEWIFLPSPEGKTWDSDYREIPHNVIEIDQEQFNKMDYVDLTFSHTIQQAQGMQSMAEFFDIRHINLTHIYPHPSFSERYINTINDTRKDAIKVFTTEDQAKEWGYDVVECHIIEHGIDTDHFNGWTGERPQILTVANFYQDRSDELGYDVYSELVRFLGDDKFIHIGKSSDNSSQPAKDINELASFYKTCGMFINTCHRSVLPTTLLEAMSTGMPVISMNNPTIDGLIINGENGFKTNTPKEIADYAYMLIHDRKLAEKIGKTARETVVERYNMEKFTNKWDNLIRSNVKI